jgi:hypothetical protein
LDLRDIEAAVLDAKLHLGLLELQTSNSKVGVLVLFQRAIEIALISALRVQRLPLACAVVLVERRALACTPKAAIFDRQTGTAVSFERLATALISAMRGHEGMLLPLLSGDGGKTHIARSADLGFAEITPQDVNWRLRAGPWRRRNCHGKVRRGISCVKDQDL